jgi:hypothetical protein
MIVNIIALDLFKIFFKRMFRFFKKIIFIFGKYEDQKTKKEKITMRLVISNPTIWATKRKLREVDHNSNNQKTFCITLYLLTCQNYFFKINSTHSFVLTLWLWLTGRYESWFYTCRHRCVKGFQTHNTKFYRVNLVQLQRKYYNKSIKETILNCLKTAQSIFRWKIMLPHLGYEMK